MEKASEFKVFPILTGLYVAALLLGNVTSQKIFSLGPFCFPGGVVIFPITFIFTDLFTEVYGYARSRVVIWTGFAAQVFAAGTYLLVGLLPSAPYWHDQAAYSVILTGVPRITLASIAASWFAEFCNSYLVSKMKYWAERRTNLEVGRRFFVSTAISALVDTLIFSFLAFGGILTAAQIGWTAFCVYAFKVSYEALCLPISVPISNWIKRIEGVDHFDDPAVTRYSPFA